MVLPSQPRALWLVEAGIEERRRVSGARLTCSPSPLPAQVHSFHPTNLLPSSY